MCVPEASKLVMSYVAAVCGKGQEVNKVKEQLLQSNPVLEGKGSVMHPLLNSGAGSSGDLTVLYRAKITLTGQLLMKFLKHTMCIYSLIDMLRTLPQLVVERLF